MAIVSSPSDCYGVTHAAEQSRTARRYVAALNAACGQGGAADSEELLPVVEFLISSAPREIETRALASALDYAPGVVQRSGLQAAKGRSDDRLLSAMVNQDGSLQALNGLKFGEVARVIKHWMKRGLKRFLP